MVNKKNQSIQWHCMYNVGQYSNNSNTDSSVIMADSNLFLSPKEILRYLKKTNIWGYVS